jgi:hypothetical protein
MYNLVDNVPNPERLASATNGHARFPTKGSALGAAEHYAKITGHPWSVYDAKGAPMVTMIDLPSYYALKKTKCLSFSGRWEGAVPVRCQNRADHMCERTGARLARCYCVFNGFRTYETKPQLFGVILAFNTQHEYTWDGPESQRQIDEIDNAIKSANAKRRYKAFRSKKR